MVAAEIDNFDDFAFDTGGRAGQNWHAGLRRWTIIGIFHLVRIARAPFGDAHDGILVGFEKEVQSEDSAGGDQAMRIAAFLNADGNQAGRIGHLRDPVDDHRIGVIAAFGRESIKAVGHHPQGIFDFIIRHRLSPLHRSITYYNAKNSESNR